MNRWWTVNMNDVAWSPRYLTTIKESVSSFCIVPWRCHCVTNASGFLKNFDFKYIFDITWESRVFTQRNIYSICYTVRTCKVKPLFFKYKICGTQCCSIILKPFRRTLALSQDFHQVEEYSYNRMAVVLSTYMYSKGRKNIPSVFWDHRQTNGPTCTTHYLKSVTCSRTHLYAQSIREKSKFLPSQS